MTLSFKWLKVSASNTTKDQKAVQMWDVRWHSLHGDPEIPDQRPE